MVKAALSFPDVAPEAAGGEADKKKEPIPVERDRLIGSGRGRGYAGDGPGQGLSGCRANAAADQFELTLPTAVARPSCSLTQRPGSSDDWRFR